MSWRVTYINREGVREAYRAALPMPFNERSAKDFAGVLNGMSDFVLASYGPQAVGTFRAEEEKPPHSEAFDLLAAENAELKAKLQLACEREFYTQARIRRAAVMLPEDHPARRELEGKP